MAKKIKWTIDKAEQVIKDYGGRVIDEKIYVPANSSGTGMDKEWDEYWSAHQWLRIEYDYDCDLDDPLAYIDLDEFLD